AGIYSVVVQNSAGTVVSGTATLSVAGLNFSGAYLGTLGSDQGPLALYVRRDNSAVFIAYVASSHGAIVQDLTIDPGGAFTVPAALSAGFAATAAKIPTATN